MQARKVDLDFSQAKVYWNPADPEYCQLLARYGRWMNERMYAAVATLSHDERKRDRGVMIASRIGVSLKSSLRARQAVTRGTSADASLGALNRYGVEGATPWQALAKPEAPW